MFELINRICWVISLCLWIIFIIFLNNILWNNDSQVSHVANTLFNISMIFWSMILTMIIKIFLFSETYIKHRLSIMTQRLQWIYWKTQREHKKVKTFSTIYKHYTLWVTKNVPQTQADDIVEKKEEPIKQEYKSNALSDKTHVIEPINNPWENNFENYIKEFLSENLLAKIWALLIFLWIVFLMTLVWDKIGDIWKILIWFFIGFSTYFWGLFLDKKWFHGESKILLWTWILINFLTILSGRYLIGGAENISWFLSSTITFILLILNTLFAIWTSFIFKSKNILIFWFLFAYLNPFLIGETSTTPYVLVWYSFIVSLWALYLSIKQNNEILKLWSFILWNILFLIAPFSLELWWFIKIFFATIFNSFVIFSGFNFKHQFLQTWWYYYSNFFILFLLFMLIEKTYDTSQWVLLWIYSCFLIYQFIIGIILYIKRYIWNILPTIWFFSFISIAIFFTFNIEYLIFEFIGIIILTFIIGFYFIDGIISKNEKYYSYIMIWFFLLVVNIILGYDAYYLWIYRFVFLLWLVALFLIANYYTAKKENDPKFATLWSLWAIALFSPIIIHGDTWADYISNSYSPILDILCIISSISVLILSGANIALPYIFKSIQSHTNFSFHYICILIVNSLFLIYQTILYWEYFQFNNIHTWIIFLVYTIIFAVIWYLSYRKDFSVHIINIFWAISGWMFITGILKLFAQLPEMKMIIWMLASIALMYLFKTYKKYSFFYWSIIFQILWVYSLHYIDYNLGQYIWLWVILPIIIINFLQLFLANFMEEDTDKWILDLLHIGTNLVIFTKIFSIIEFSNNGIAIAILSALIAISTFIYFQLKSKILHSFITLVFWFFCFYHVWNIFSIFEYLSENNIEKLKLIQYLVVLILGLTLFITQKNNKKIIHFNFLNGIFTFYSIIIVTYYIFDIFQTTFAITFMWWLISTLFLSIWIWKKLIYLRTIGLYILSIVLSKIFLFDIWYWLEDGISRVIALIVLGILLIILSTQYTKKIWNNLTWEFDISNILK